MKYSITKKLIFYFTIVLIIFAIIVGGIFIFLFAQYNLETHKQNLEERVTHIAEILGSSSGGMGNSHSQGNNQMGISNNTLKVLTELEANNVWIIDQNFNLYSNGNGHHQITYTELPEEADTIIKQAFEGNIEFSDQFSNVLEVDSLTVAAPIKNNLGTIIAVVLLHAPVQGISAITIETIKLIGISSLIGFILVVIIAVILSKKFIYPLKKLEKVTEELAQGDYEVRSEIEQVDEIGNLANSIDHLAESLQQASVESEKLDQLQKQFIANISHELRTPITVLRGSLEALIDGVVVNEIKQKEYFNQMLNESIHLQRLVNDLLELTRLQNNSFKIEKDRVDVVQIVMDVVRGMRLISKEKEVDILLNSDVPSYFYQGDYSRLRQMLMIVIDNSIKFSDFKGKIVIDVVANREGLIISVEDYGIGMSQAEIENIFNYFYRASSDANGNGTGLGLAIAKEIALRHGIDIKIESEKNRKTNFIFIFSGN